MGAGPFQEPAALSAAERLFDFLSNARQAFGLYPFLLSSLTCLCQPGNEADVVRAQFKLGGRRVSVPVRLHGSNVGVREKTLPDHHRSGAERAFTPLVP